MEVCNAMLETQLHLHSCVCGTVLVAVEGDFEERIFPEPLRCIVLQVSCKVFEVRKKQSKKTFWPQCAEVERKTVRGAHRQGTESALPQEGAGKHDRPERNIKGTLRPSRMDHADLQIRRPKIFFRELTQSLPVTFIGGRTEHAAGDFCLHPFKIKRGNDLFRWNARDIPIMQNQMDEELYILFRNIPAAQNSRGLLLIMQEQVFPGSKRHGLVGTAVGCAGRRRTDDVVPMLACPERIALKEAFSPGAEKTTTFSGKSCGIMDMLQQGITPDDVRAAVGERCLFPQRPEAADSRIGRERVIGEGGIDRPDMFRPQAEHALRHLERRVGADLKHGFTLERRAAMELFQECACIGTQRQIVEVHENLP